MAVANPLAAMRSTSSRWYLVESRRTSILPSRIQAEKVEVQILSRAAASADEIQSGGVGVVAGASHSCGPYFVFFGGWSDVGRGKYRRRWRSCKAGAVFFSIFFLFFAVPEGAGAIYIYRSIGAARASAGADGAARGDELGILVGVVIEAAIEARRQPGHRRGRRIAEARKMTNRIEPAAE